MVVSVADRKFAVKARLYQALGVTLAVVRSYLHSPKVLQSLISVLKLYATDGQQTYHHITVVVTSSRCFLCAYCSLSFLLISFATVTKHYTDQRAVDAMWLGR